MINRYFDFFGTPAKIIVDDDVRERGDVYGR